MRNSYQGGRGGGRGFVYTKFWLFAVVRLSEALNKLSATTCTTIGVICQQRIRVYAVRLDLDGMVAGYRDDERLRFLHRRQRFGRSRDDTRFVILVVIVVFCIRNAPLGNASSPTFQGSGSVQIDHIHRIKR
jgi:hypothetical protein